MNLTWTGRYWGAVFLLMAGLESLAQNTTNEGTDFWTTFTSHINVENGQLSQPGMALYITSSVSTSGTVSIPGQGFSRQFTVSPNRITTVPLPFSSSYTGSSEAVEFKGIHIASGEPVVVYSHIFGEKRSGATLVMPTRSLGQEYRAITYNEDSQFTIIGVEDDTHVEITPTAQTEGGRPAGVPFSITLQRGEVYQVRSPGDLTGSRITTKIPENSTCKKIAVYSGSKGVRIGCGNQGHDNLYQQLFAFSSWGKNYIAVPMENRPYDLVRILAGDLPSTVTVNGTSYTLNPGEYREISFTSPLAIQSTQPVSIAQFTPSQACDDRNPRDDLRDPFYHPPYPGDPDMVILSPIEQNLREITLYSSSAQDITDNYINVIIGTNDVASFTLDGMQPSPSFVPVPANPAYSYARFRVPTGTHHLAAAGGFNAIAYGFGNYESYAYLAGTNLIDFSKFIRHETGPEIYTGLESCDGRTVRFSAELDFLVYSFRWDFGDGEVTEPEDDLSKLSAYEHTYKSAGDYTARLIILKSDGSECGDKEDLVIEYEFTVEPNPYPEPDFQIPPSCVEDLVRFENLTSIADDTEITYLWDFGDGGTSHQRHPQHRYAEPGIYRVILLATSRYGCTRQLSKDITINAADPVAAFDLPGEICQNLPAQFSDQSTVSFGEITSWHWDFNNEGSSTEKNPQFQFPTPGEKQITLTVSTGTACFTAVSRRMIVHAVTQPEFVLPTSDAWVCLNTPPFPVTGFFPPDGYQGGQGQLSAATGLDAKGVFDPAKAGAGRHELYYTFTNAQGCSETATQILTVQELPRVDAGKDQRILEGNSTLLNGSTTGVRFEWAPADGLDNPFILNPRAAPQVSTTYTLTAWNDQGCVSLSEVRVEVLGILKVPNLFTPNNDGTNDRWYIGNIEDYPQCVVQVFNRFGQRVYYSEGYPEAWDGTAGGRILPAATYYYVIKPHQSHPEISGSVTIVR